MSDEQHRDSGSGAEERRNEVRAASERPGPDSVARIARGLADSDWRVRKEAAAAAGRFADDPKMIEILVDALLQLDDVGFRNAAIEAFGHIGPRGAGALERALARAPETARKFVCAAMAFCGPSTVPALTRMSGDPDPNTAIVALESLARIGGGEAERAMRDQLEHRDRVVRLAALQGLSRLGARVPLALLVGMRNDPMLRRSVLPLLGRCGDPGAAPHLARGLRDIASMAEIGEIATGLEVLAGAGPECAEAVAAEARSLGAPELAALRGLLGEEDTAVACAAAFILVLARDREALGPIASLATRVELPPRVIFALRALGATAVRPLLAVAPRLDPSARGWALELAAELAACAHAERALDPGLSAEVRAALRSALESREEAVVQAAARALSHFAEPEDAAALVRLGGSGSAAVARAAARALEALSLSAPAAIGTALDHASPDGAEAWSAVIAVLPEDVALEKLRAATSSGEPGARRAAVLALDRVDGVEAAEIAAVALADEDVDVRVAAATVLARMRDPAARAVATRSLRLALRESSPPVRAAAARGLGALGDADACAALQDLVRDSAPGVAVAALAALRELGITRRAAGPELDGLLVDVFGHPDEEVVKEALRFVAESRASHREVRLAAGLAHPAWDVRRLAAMLLGEIGTTEALEHLRARAEVENDDLVRAALAQALGRGGGAA